MNFGVKLKTQRLAKGFTQELLAEKIGVKKQTISRYENSEREPNLPTAKKIANALGISLEELAATGEKVVPATTMSNRHSEEEYEEPENILRDYVMKAYSLHPENFQKLKEYLELLVLSQRDQDD